MSKVLIPRSEPIIKRGADPKPAWGRDSDGLLWIRCACGLPMTLQHDIAPNGDVNPSLWHDDPGCGWHVYGTLQNWDGGVV